jgi:DNA-binding response OmpR family regulator
VQQTSLAQYMQTQRELYAATLQEKIAALEAALQQLSAGSFDAASPALAQAHKLAGSGGTFGLPAISEAAAGIEKILLNDAGHQHTLGELQRKALADGLQALKAALLPVVNGGAPKNSADNLAQHGEAVAPQTKKSTRLVHIIESDQRAASELAVQLGLAGYRSRISERPVSPEPADAQDRPAALLVNLAFSADLSLARMSGEVADIPVIFISGGTDFQARLQAVRAGAIGYFPRPLEVHKLLVLLDRVTSAEPAQPYRVMIVEDDEALATFYASVLQSASIETMVVTDPSQVMAHLIEFQPDLITCDIYMPQCNGVELAALIRQQQEFVRIPIVFLSTETSLDKQAQALKPGTSLSQFAAGRRHPAHQRRTLSPGV